MSKLDNIDLHNWFHILNTLPNPVTLNRKIIDIDGNPNHEITYVNDAFKNLIGYTTDDLTTDIEWFELIKQANKNYSNPLGFPACVTCKDNIERWFQVSTSLDYPISNEFRITVFIEIQAHEDTLPNSQTTTHSLCESKEKLANQINLTQKIINAVPVRVFWKDKEGNFLGANKLFLQDAQLESTEDIIGKNDFEMPWAKTEAQRYRDDDLSVMNSEVSKINFEESQTDNEGNIITLLTSKAPLKDESGAVNGILGTYSDISKQRNTENELQQQKEKLYHQKNNELDKRVKLLNKLTENVPGAIYQYKVSPDGEASFPYASDNIYNVYEVKPNEVMANAQAVFDNLHSEDMDMIATSIEESMKTMNDWQLEYRVSLPIKGVRWLEGHAKPEKLEDGSVLWHGYINDITERKEAEQLLLKQQETLQHQAHYDSLTGLPNRILFNDRLEKAIVRAKRHSTKVAVLFIDLDHFKEINDSLGHDIGDIVLTIITKRLKGIIRAEDTIARLGGDEFIIVLEDIEYGGTTIVANKILQGLSESMTINEQVLYISSSIGISIYPDDGKNSSSLLKFSDSAMYKAKNEGRNIFQYYDSKMTELALERVVMETNIRRGIKNEEFIVYYQPQVDGKTNTLIGMEALVRWNHPTMGLIPPDKFIPVAESTGLIVELDRYVMKAAMTQIVQWYKEGLNPGVLAMNLAIKQLQHKDCILILRDLMKNTGCKPQWIELEVAEGQVMTHPEESIKILKQISDLGIELAIDDFGTGYASLAYLKRLPIDKIKIDQIFIRDLPGNDQDIGITKAVIALSKSLNLKVIAEGVETKEQRDFLVAHGCSNIQGYFYAKPMPAEAMEKMLISDKSGLVKI